MHTRCPQCRTVFRLTPALLKAHGGKVRCGRCQHVFQAEQHLVEHDARPAPTTAERSEAPVRKRATRKSPRPAPAARPQRTKTADALETLLEPPVSGKHKAAAPEPVPLPSPSFALPPDRSRRIFWSAVSFVMLLVLAGQITVFYGQDLVRMAPALRAPVAQLCHMLPCQRLAPIDMRRLDLVETRVTPHPRYDRALKVRATIVNRGERAQPYPLLEISLIDSQGLLVARRTYRPQEYLESPDRIPAGLPPQLAVNVSLDITSPGPKASGFEVLLLPPSD